MSGRCTVPPSGWYCTRGAGHDGPCAAAQVEGWATGWASPTLGRAYNDIEKLRESLAQPTESGIDEALNRALEAIEAADVELVGIAS